jgi:hypothetical protein
MGILPLYIRKKYRIGSWFYILTLAVDITSDENSMEEWKNGRFLYKTYPVDAKLDLLSSF